MKFSFQHSIHKSNLYPSCFATLDNGNISELLHENYLRTQNAKEKWNATIDHTARNLENSINNIYKISYE